MFGKLFRRKPKKLDHDPFVTLNIEQHLARINDEIIIVRTDHSLSARGHKLMVLHGAYDSLLSEAARVTSIPVNSRTLGQLFSASERFELEMALTEHGWNW